MGRQSPASPDPGAIELAKKLHQAAISAIERAKNEKRPTVRCETKNGLVEDALYDTGSAISGVSLKFFSGQKESAIPYTGVDALLDITAVTGEKMPILGCYTMSFKIFGKWRTGRWFVFDNLSADILMGIDFIKEHGLDYKARTGQIVPDDHSVEGRGFISTVEAVKIPANSSRTVRVNGNFKARENQAWIAAICCKEFPVAGNEALIKVNSEQNATVILDNLLDVDVTVPRNLVVGSVQAVDLEKCVEIDLSKIGTPEVAPPPGNKCDEEKAKVLEEAIRQQLENVPEEFRKDFINLILENHDVFSRDKSDLGLTHAVEHVIRLKDGSPAYRKQFRIPEEHRSILIEHLMKWLKLKVVSPSSSHYNSPIFLVPKKDGTMRPVLDFREVNKKSFIDKYSQREVSDCLDELGRSKSKVFTSLDLTAGYWQVPLAKESRKATAFTIPGLGSFEWNRTPMGLLGAPATFARVMDVTVRGLQAIAYQDDLLVHTKSITDHLDQLRKVFGRLRAQGFKLNAKKCYFMQPEVPYLGFTLTRDGVLPGKDKCSAILNCKPPRTVKQVREFVGMCNYFRASVDHFAQKAAPLNKLLSGHSKWRGGELPEEALKAFRVLQQVLASPPVLAFPDPTKEYHLSVDASQGLRGEPGGLGASLIQEDDEGNPRAIGFASRGLIDHEKNYTAYLLELRAAVFGIEYFDTYLKGRHFFLHSDHRPMEKLGATHTKTLNRLQELMSHFDFTIVYRPGKDNVVADFLSRNVAAMDVGPNLLKKLQSEDPFIRMMREEMEKDNPDAKVKRLLPSIAIENGIVYYKRPAGGKAIFAPKKIVPQIIKAAHDSLLGGHMGIFKTRNRILKSYYWPGMDKDVQEHVTSCLNCQKIKPWSNPTKVPLRPLDQPSSPFHRLHVDLFGPLHDNNGKKMVMVMTDAFTKYVELAALESKSAQEVAKAIMDYWITRYSTPREIVTDGGKEFANQLLDAICVELGALHKVSSPYHPETNGCVEVFNRTMKNYLAAAIEPPYTEWEHLLPALRICYNTSVSKATMTTPFALTFGMEHQMPIFDLEKSLDYNEDRSEHLVNLQAMRKKAEELNLGYRKKYKVYYDKLMKAMKRDLKVGDFVVVKNNHKTGKNPKLQPNWTGEYQVVEVLDENVRYRDGKKVKIAHFNRVKKVKKMPDGSSWIQPAPRVVEGSTDTDYEWQCILPTLAEPGSDMEGHSLWDLSGIWEEIQNEKSSKNEGKENSQIQKIESFRKSSGNFTQQQNLTQHFESDEDEDEDTKSDDQEVQVLVDDDVEMRDAELSVMSGPKEQVSRPLIQPPKLRFANPEESCLEHEQDHEVSMHPKRLDFSDLDVTNPVEFDTSVPLPADSPFPPTPWPYVRPGVGAKRKPTSPLADNPKRVDVERPCERALRSRGPVQVNMAVPDRPQEWKTYSSKSSEALNDQRVQSDQCET